MLTYRHNFPRVLLSSALCRCGYWSASFLRAACAQTMNAFMGLLTWGLFFKDPLPLTGMGTKDQSYPLRTWETASRMQAGNRSSSSESSFLPRPAIRDPRPSEPVGEDGASESDSSWDMELFVPDGLHGWSLPHLSCSSVIFNIICSAPLGLEIPKRNLQLKTKMCPQQSGQCAFYARCATVNSFNDFSQYESVVSLLLPCLFVCLSPLLLSMLSWEVQSWKLWSTMWAEELHAPATWVAVLKPSLHPPPGIGWNKSPLSPHWLQLLRGLYYLY